MTPAPTLRQRIGRALRALATKIDPQGKPGRKRKDAPPLTPADLEFVESRPLPRFDGGK